MVPFQFMVYVPSEKNYKPIEKINKENIHDEEELVNLKSKANYKTLGRRLGSRMKTAAESIAKLDLNQIRSIQNGENISIKIISRIINYNVRVF